MENTNAGEGVASMAIKGWRAEQTDIGALLAARHADPFGLLGLHEASGGFVLRAFVPDASSLTALLDDGAAIKLTARGSGFFEQLFPKRTARFAYRLRAENSGGCWEFGDPYCFPPVLGATDDHLLIEGTHHRLYERLGAQLMTLDGVPGVHFAVWAPNAQRVSLVGDFNRWDGRIHQMRKRIDSGLWEIFIPDLSVGAVYKFEIIGKDGTLLPLKADPFGFSAERRPSTASAVARTDHFIWTDEAYLRARGRQEAHRAPMSIYEVHLGSWMRREDGDFLSYDEFAGQLLPYAAGMGFTHIELLPICEHPLDASWGYQPIGLFAPSKRFGDPAGFARFVDRAHALGLGIILDWVPAHFPTDIHGLAQFDGTALYEHADPRRGFHPDWNTAIYDFGRREVVSFLCANALYWLDRFHLDGLRVDAVASMLYLDYSRKHGEWLPNSDGSNDNRDAVAFLRQFNTAVYAQHPASFTLAEESTAWPGVSRPVHENGLGFGFKWNMGWMHDTLDYFAMDPVHRKWHHNKLTFGTLYAFTENFVLPLSHDEVVHGKSSILGKMPGDEWQRFANLRAYYAFMWGHPGKKLLFMGQEFGQSTEWNFDSGLPWHLLEHSLHQGVQKLVRDLNLLHRTVPALHTHDCEADGFRWIVVDDSEQSVIAWLRMGGEGDHPVAVVCNLTPVPRHGYRIGLPHAGIWREILNTDAVVYGGGGGGNLGQIRAISEASHGFNAMAEILIPALSTVYFEYADHE